MPVVTERARAAVEEGRGSELREGCEVGGREEEGSGEDGRIQVRRHRHREARWGRGGGGREVRVPGRGAQTSLDNFVPFGRILDRDALIVRCCVS